MDARVEPGNVSQRVCMWRPLYSAINQEEAGRRREGEALLSRRPSAKINDRVRGWIL